MATKRIERAERLLERVKLKTGLTEAGKEWLVTAFDPFHDEKPKCHGYPDREVGPSIVQVVKQSFSVKSPFGAGKTWSFSVIMDDDMLPTTNKANTQIYSNQIEIEGDQASDIFKSGGIVAVAQDQSGTPITNLVTYPGGTATRMLVGDANIGGQVKGKHRILGMGFELINTSAQLYKGGTVTCWEQNTTKSEPQAYGINYYITVAEQELKKKAKIELKDGEQETKKKTKIEVKDGTLQNSKGISPMIADTFPPFTQQQALLLPGTMQWGAEKGCYMVGMMNDMDNPPKYCDNISKIYSHNELVYPVSTNILEVDAVFLDTGFAYSGFDSETPTWVKNMHDIVPFNRKGAFVTGLTAESTFTVNYNVIIETFPTHTNSQLILLAQPSASEDYIATQLYSEAAQNLPVACIVDDNSAAEWFLGIADTVIDAVSEIAKPVMGAMEGWKNNRGPNNNNNNNNNNNSGQQTWTSPNVGSSYGSNTTSKEAGKFNKKKGVTVEGPRLPNNKFKSQSAKEQQTKNKNKK